MLQRASQPGKRPEIQGEIIVRSSVFLLEKVSQMTYYFTKVGNDAKPKTKKAGKGSSPSRPLQKTQTRAS